MISLSWPWPILTLLRRSGEHVRAFRSSSFRMLENVSSLHHAVIYNHSSTPPLGVGELCRDFMNAIATHSVQAGTCKRGFFKSGRGVLSTKRCSNYTHCTIDRYSVSNNCFTHSDRDRWIRELYGQNISPRLYTEKTGNCLNSRIISRGAVLVTYVWYILNFARINHFTCMLYVLVINLSVV